MTCVNTLSIVVRYLPGTGRCPTATEIRIMLGTRVVANLTLGGRCSQKDAMAEFKRNPAQFQPGEAFDVARSLRLVA